jgi:hypothetical protein
MRKRFRIASIAVAVLLAVTGVALLCRSPKLSAEEEEIYEAVFRNELDRFEYVPGGWAQAYRLQVEGRRLSPGFLGRFASYRLPVTKAPLLEKGELSDIVRSWVPGARRPSFTSRVLLFSAGAVLPREDGAVEVGLTFSMGGRPCEGKVYTLVNRSGRWVVTDQRGLWSAS